MDYFVTGGTGFIGRFSSASCSTVAAASTCSCAKRRSTASRPCAKRYPQAAERLPRCLATWVVPGWGWPTPTWTG